MGQRIGPGMQLGTAPRDANPFEKAEPDPVTLDFDKPAGQSERVYRRAPRESINGRHSPASLPSASTGTVTDHWPVQLTATIFRAVDSRLCEGRPHRLRRRPATSQPDPARPLRRGRRCVETERLCGRKDLARFRNDGHLRSAAPQVNCQHAAFVVHQQWRRSCCPRRSALIGTAAVRQNVMLQT